MLLIGKELSFVEMLTEAINGTVNDYSVYGNWSVYYKNWYDKWMSGDREIVFATMPYIPSIIK